MTKEEIAALMGDPKNSQIRDIVDFCVDERLKSHAEEMEKRKKAGQDAGPLAFFDNLFSGSK